MTKIIIDVGASNGHFAVPWSYNYSDYNIYCFEPNNKNYKLLEQRTKNIENIKIYKKAISNNSCIKRFYEANYTNSSSLLPFNKAGVDKWKNPTPTIPKLKTIDEYDVECVRLDEWLEQNNLNDVIDFIKIDTQGHDLEVIKSLGDKIKNVKEITAEVQTVETEVYKNSSKRENLLKYMKEQGFSIWKIQPWSHNQEQNIWFTNDCYNNYLHLQ
jgi:FkbM family methyltransferase